jgi:hypothetical protein
MTPSRTLLRLLLLPILLACLPAAAGAAPVGEAGFVRGAVTAGPEGGETRFLARGEPFFQGDVVTTGPGSIAILLFADGARITLRPDSVFAVDAYERHRERPSAWLRLLKGGIRAASGLFAKENPGTGLTLETPTAVCGIRGTEFDARICEGGGCDEEARQKGPRGGIGPPDAVGRVVRLEGRLRAEGEDGKKRTLVEGGPVYRRDTLTTDPNGYAVVAFRDRSRVTLQGESRFEVARFAFQDPDKADSVLLRLLHGGLRILSGLTARKGPDAFRIETPNAACGVRGTGVDLFHQPVPKAGREAGAPQPGSYAHVWDGGVMLESRSGGTLRLDVSQTGFVPVPAGPPALLPALPAFMRDNPAPRPDRVKVDHEALFGAADWETFPPGLYVSVYDGHVTMSNAAGLLHLGRGEAGHAGPGTLTRLRRQPPFQVNDPVPRPEMLEQGGVLVLESILEEFGLSPVNRSFECEVQ